ncbi:MAG: cytochrome d ubiquinol oxidase subunit II [Gammaproteobacteria bacterium]
MLFDYETLKLIWWLLVGALLIGFALTDGFDLGIGSLLPFLGMNDEQRRVIINSIGPTWDGNQVWLVTAGGALFAAWPMVYAAAFSGFYVALILVLFTLILRPVGFDFRGKLAGARWRSIWDWGLFLGGAVPALVFGVAFGNLLLGVPFHYDDDLRSYYTGSFFGLLNPFALLTGIVSLSMLLMHGAIFLQLRTEGVISERAVKAATLSAGVFIAAFALSGIWLAFGIDGYRIIDMPDPGSAFTPLAKTVETIPGAWLDNYGRYPWMMVAPVLGFAGAVLALVLSRAGRAGLAFIMSCLAITGVILTAGLSMFPFVMPSSTQPAHSLTAWDATSSHLTLTWMFWAVVLFLPIVIAYTSWVFGVMRGKVTEARIREETHTAY